MEHPHCKAVFGRKTVKIGPENGGFSGIRGSKCYIFDSNPEKAHPCARCLTYCV